MGSAVLTDAPELRRTTQQSFLPHLHKVCCKLGASPGQLSAHRLSSDLGPLSLLTLSHQCTATRQRRESWGKGSSRLSSYMFPTGRDTRHVCSLHLCENKSHGPSYVRGQGNARGFQWEATSQPGVPAAIKPSAMAMMMIGTFCSQFLESLSCIFFIPHLPLPFTTNR